MSEADDDEELMEEEEELEGETITRFTQNPWCEFERRLKASITGQTNVLLRKIIALHIHEFVMNLC